jgi:hypothetical protein
MENSDLIIGSIIVTISFIAFGVTTYNEFKKEDSKSIK